MSRPGAGNSMASPGSCSNGSASQSRSLCPRSSPVSPTSTYKPVFALPQDVPTVDVAVLMAHEGIRNVVITDAAGKPVGMIGEHALANAYIGTLHLAELAVTPVPIGTLARVLSAEIIVSAHPSLKAGSISRSTRCMSRSRR